MTIRLSLMLPLCHPSCLAWRRGGGGGEGAGGKEEEMTGYLSFHQLPLHRHFWWSNSMIPPHIAVQWARSITDRVWGFQTPSLTFNLLSDNLFWSFDLGLFIHFGRKTQEMHLTTASTTTTKYFKLYVCVLAGGWIGFLLPVSLPPTWGCTLAHLEFIKREARARRSCYMRQKHVHNQKVNNTFHPLNETLVSL